MEVSGDLNPDRGRQWPLGVLGECYTLKDAP